MGLLFSYCSFLFFLFLFEVVSFFVVVLEFCLKHSGKRVCLFFLLYFLVLC